LIDAVAFISPNDHKAYWYAEKCLPEDRPISYPPGTCICHLIWKKKKVFADAINLGS
jgi:hypothetical protein